MQTKSIDRFSNEAGFYIEYQRFAAWVYVLVVAIACATTAGVLTSMLSKDGPAAPPELLLPNLLLILFLFNILVLRTSVDGEALRMRLGWPVPIFWKRVEIASIQNARVVTYRPLRDAGGWGLRFGRFDGVFTIYWNARGNRGVLIETEKRRYIIGSQDPEALCAAIERARGEVKRT